ncbi:MAG: Calx-beta domain-containing protein [Desulfobacteraceae bacterium]
MPQCTMNSFRPIILMVIVLTIGLAPVAGQAQTSCGEITETALIAGQNIPVGTVVVENDEQYLYVTYQTDGNWLITETHLDVATRPEDLKQTSKGNAVPGRFAYQSQHDPGVALVTHTIDLAAWPSGTQLYLAAHSVVVSDFGSETAWGEGIDFPGKNWAMYFSHLVQSCDPPQLEPGIIDLLPPAVDVQEYGVSIRLQLIRTNGSDGPATVLLDVQDISATLGVDYTIDTNTVSFGDGETEKFVEVFILDDTDPEYDEQFKVQISNVTGAEMGANTSTICTIIDDDRPIPN